jgi:hypothetical protein
MAWGVNKIYASEGGAGRVEEKPDQGRRRFRARGDGARRELHVALLRLSLHLRNDLRVILRRPPRLGKRLRVAFEVALALHRAVGLEDVG